jgi:hypothetical protein
MRNISALGTSNATINVWTLISTVVICPHGRDGVDTDLPRRHLQDKCLHREAFEENGRSAAWLPRDRFPLTITAIPGAICAEMPFGPRGP